MKFDEQAQIAFVPCLDRGSILVTNHARRAYRFIGPLGDCVAMPFQPNIGKQPRPSSVAVEKWVDENGPMMKSRGLFKNRHGGFPRPMVQVVEQILKVYIDLRGWEADVEFCQSFGPGPFPDLTEHLIMKL